VTWTPIPGLGGWYEVNQEGQVRSYRVQGSRDGARRAEPKILKVGLTRGQAHVNLCHKGVARSITIAKILRVTFEGEDWDVDARYANG
jgi:hypothetical protein